MVGFHPPPQRMKGMRMGPSRRNRLDNSRRRALIAVCARPKAHLPHVRRHTDDLAPFEWAYSASEEMLRRVPGVRGMAVVSLVKCVSVVVGTVCTPLR